MCCLKLKYSEMMTPSSCALSVDFTVHEPTVSEGNDEVAFFIWLQVPIQRNLVYLHSALDDYLPSTV